MLILLNPSACEGNAIKKWEKIKDDLFLKYGKADIITVNGTATKNEIKKYIERGETDFIAAGGDGTINHLLNDIVRLTNGNLKDIRIGAIGLGSSNDFHKPYNRDRLVGQVYCRMDFNNTIKHDLCKVIYEDENHNTYSKYFVLNSSIGITAKANFLFNRPDRILSYLKRKNTNIAILYAAIKTILTFKNIKVYVNSKEYSREIKLTNMGIVKNPNFSGSFCYDTEYNSGNGTFWIHICENMSILRTLLTLFRLSKKRFSSYPYTFSFESNDIQITSDEKFAVEFDGEVIETKNVIFRIIQGALNICS